VNSVQALGGKDACERLRAVAERPYQATRNEAPLLFFPPSPDVIPPALGAPLEPLPAALVPSHPYDSPFNHPERPLATGGAPSQRAYVGGDPRPLILFEIHALVPPAFWHAVATGAPLPPPRPGVQHLVSLIPRRRLGIYTTAPAAAARCALAHIQAYLASLPQVKAHLSVQAHRGAPFQPPTPDTIFSVLLHAAHCRASTMPDADGNGGAAEILKPLSLHGADPRRTLLVDCRRRGLGSAAGKALCIALPPCRAGVTETESVLDLAAKQVPLLRVLCALVGQVKWPPSHQQAGAVELSLAAVRSRHILLRHACAVAA
jgi:hypothetical protein